MSITRTDTAVTLDGPHLDLLRRLCPEMSNWPGAEETPHGVYLSEADDELLWEIIVTVMPSAAPAVVREITTARLSDLTGKKG